jgi:hypothetical protein
MTTVVQKFWLLPEVQLVIVVAVQWTVHFLYLAVLDLMKASGRMFQSLGSCKQNGVQLNVVERGGRVHVCLNTVCNYVYVVLLQACSLVAVFGCGGVKHWWSIHIVILGVLCDEVSMWGLNMMGQASMRMDEVSMFPWR